MAVPAELIKELREKTQSAIKDCKEALEQSENNLEKALEYLRKKGLADAKKKEACTTSAGRIFSYIHSNNQIGVMLELNCQTDFVANTDEFKTLGLELCLQVCAMSPTFVRREEIPTEIVAKELEIYREQAQDKPEKIRDNIVHNKLEKYYKDACLLEQAYIKDESFTIAQFIQNKVAVIKENITVKRFARFQIAQK